MKSMILKTVAFSFVATIAGTALTNAQEKDYFFCPQAWALQNKCRQEARQAREVERAAAAAAKAAEVAKHNQVFDVSTVLQTVVDGDKDQSISQVIIVRKDGTKDTFTVPVVEQPAPSTPAVATSPTKTATTYKEMPLRRYGNQIRD